MSVQLSWVGEDALDRVARTRFRCYAPADNTFEKFANATRLDGRQKPGDVLLATRDGRDVGTATSLSLQMWCRGARFQTQGIAWVGTIKSARRGGSGDARGVASLVMAETLRLGRERGDVVSALMPFRASFYEHFGFGNAERRVEWTVPTAILPRGPFDGWREYESADDDLLLDLRETEAQRGQCDVETSPAALANWQREWSNGLGFVEQAATGDGLTAWCHIVEERGPQTATAVVDDWSVASPASLRHLLHFLASLKDQYTFVRLTLPADVPLNRLLRETQIPHRQVDHPVAASRPFTRMQVRVLDHRRFLEALTLPESTTGKLNVAIHECEGTTSRLGLDFQAGRCAAGSAAGTPDVELSDVLWASIVTGDLRAADARRLGLISADDRAIALLDAFAAGPAPFCQEYF